MKKVGVTMEMLVLFKFAQEEHLTALRHQGLLHMKTMRHFGEAEKENPARGDRFEGASQIFQPADVKMTFAHPQAGTHEVDSGDLVGPVILSNNFGAERNIFCMFSLTEPTTTRTVLHADHMHFGSHFILILNRGEFFERINRELLRLGLSGTRGSVTYYDKSSYSGRVGPFQKPNSFAYQQEYRIVVWPGEVPSRNLMIGDISDITSPIHPLSDFDKLVDFSQEAAIAAGILGSDNKEQGR
jgi:hypothetical protein